MKSQKEYKREYYCNNVEKRKEYLLKNKEKISKRNKVYREKNREKLRATKKAWLEKNREKNKLTASKWYEQNKFHVRAARLKYQYNLSQEQYDEMEKSQNGTCKICEQPEVQRDRHTKTVKRLAVDHNHTTGQVRALLCAKCNSGIGQFKENPHLLQRAILYLKHHANNS